jgi:hypothetical protein
MYQALVDEHGRVKFKDHFGAKTFSCLKKAGTKFVHRAVIGSGRFANSDPDTTNPPDPHHCCPLLRPCKNFFNQLSWDQLHLVPGAEELMGIPLEHDSQLKAVRKSSPYTSEEEYMDTYFRLHRTDCFASIQKVFKGIVS